MLNAFLAYLEEQVRHHSIYVWGAQGQRSPVVNEAWIRKMEKTRKNADRAVAYWERQVEAGYGSVLRAFDCSGLGVCFLLENGFIERDMTANSLMGKCTVISPEDLRPGDFVFHVDKGGRAYHIGYAVDKSRTIIEAKGRDKGVVKAPFRGWKVCGRPPYFYEDGFRGFDRILKLKTPYRRGMDVLTLQKALAKRGYSPGRADGVFGANTEKAVRAFQTAEKLEVDGAVGPITLGRLGL